MPRRRELTLALLLLGAPAAALAAGPWQRAALYGGDVRTLAVDPGQPERLLAGTASGQVFESRDGAGSWEALGDLPFAGWVVSDLVFDPNHRQRVWVALRSLRGEAGSVALSEDGGRTWHERVTGLDRRQVYALAAVPGEPGLLYAATRQGVFGSRDHGRNWHHLTGDFPEIEKVTSLYVDAERPGTVFAGTWRRAYRSTNGGRTWSGVFAGMALDSEVFTLQSEPGDAATMWASTCGWVYRSRDGGSSWQRFNQGLAERRTPSFRTLAGGAVLAGTVAGAYRSADGGASWRRVTSEELAILDIATHPHRPEFVFLATEGGGVWRSDDGGLTFAAANRGLAAVRVADLARSGDEVLAVVRDAGPARGLYSSYDGGRSYPVQAVGLPPVERVVADGGRVLALTERGVYERRDGVWRRLEGLAAERFDQLVVGAGRTLVRGQRGVFERAADRFRPLAFGPGIPRSLALVDHVLWVSTEDGALYRVASEPARVAAPAAGRLHPMGDGLLLEADDGLWLRADLEQGWRRLASGRTRLLATGESRFPFVAVQSQGVALLDARAEPRRVETSVPPLELEAALIVGERLLLGTTGNGVWIGNLAGAAAGATAAGAP